MSRRGLGFGFCAIAAFLYAINYLAAVLFMPNITAWRNPPGRLGTAYVAVGDQPLTIAIVALIIGLVLIACAEIGERKNKSEGE